MTHWPCLPRACMTLCMCMSVFRCTSSLVHRFRMSSIALHPNLNCNTVYIHFCTYVYLSVMAYVWISLCIGVHVQMEDRRRCQMCWGRGIVASDRELPNVKAGTPSLPLSKNWNWTWSLQVHPNWPASPQILLSLFSIAGVIAVQLGAVMPSFYVSAKDPNSILTVARHPLSHGSYHILDFHYWEKQGPKKECICFSVF